MSGITMVNLASSQPIPDHVLTAVAWDCERQDDLYGWAADENADKVFAPADGIYIAHAETCWDDTFDIDVTLYHHLERIRQADGMQEVLKAWQVVHPTEATSGGGCFPLTLLAGDAIRLRVYQSSGIVKLFGGKNRTAGDPPTESRNTEMSLMRLA
jgi:hypothetical protein